MANSKEGEPQRVSRREILGKAAFYGGGGVALTGCFGILGAIIFESKNTQEEAKASNPDLVTNNQYQAAKDYLKQSDQAILKATDDGRYADIPSLDIGGDPKRRHAKIDVQTYAREQAELGTLTMQRLEPIFKPGLVAVGAGFVTAIAGLIAIPGGERDNNNTSKPPQPNVQPSKP